MQERGIGLSGLKTRVFQVSKSASEEAKIFRLFRFLCNDRTFSAQLRRNGYIPLHLGFHFPSYLFPYILGIRRSFCLHIPGSQPWVSPYKFDVRQLTNSSGLQINSPLIGANRSQRPSRGAPGLEGHSGGRGRAMRLSSLPFGSGNPGLAATFATGDVAQQKGRSLC
jgi:hypothetical protein